METGLVERFTNEKKMAKSLNKKMAKGMSKKIKKLPEKVFEDFTVAELREIIESQLEELAARPEMDVQNEDLMWMDEQHMFEDDPKQNLSGDLLNLNWKSEPENYGDSKWVRVDSVMDSGASAPVAPPTMMPNVQVLPSEGSRRGQTWSSASKHKIKNLGEQRLRACTDEGDEMEVLFQIADVSKPLASVSAICERGNRVIFGRNGGVVQSLKSGKLIPFERRNGIYVLSLWLEDKDQSDFPRR